MTKIALMIKGTLQIQWPHLQCYHFYELVILSEGNSTVLLNKVQNIWGVFPLVLSKREKNILV